MPLGLVAGISDDLEQRTHRSAMPSMGRITHDGSMIASGASSNSRPGYSRVEAIVVLGPAGDRVIS
jgi:hypothetical protein